MEFIEQNSISPLPKSAHLQLLSTGSQFGEIKRVVVIDDEPQVCDLVVEALAEMACIEAHAFSSPEEAEAYLIANPFDIVITDLSMGRRSGIEFLELARRLQDDAVVIVMTAFPTTSTAISVLQKGGFDYLVKPFKLEAIRAVVQRGILFQNTTRENVRLKREIGLLKVSRAVMSDHTLEDILSHSLESAYHDLSASAVCIRLVSGNSAIDSIQRLRCDNGDLEALQYLFCPLPTLSLGDSVLSVCEDRPTASGAPRAYLRTPLRWADKHLGWLMAVVDHKPREIDTRVCEMLASNISAVVSQRILTDRLSESYLQAIRALAGAIEARDRYTAGHTERVSQMAEIVALAMGWDEAKIIELRQGCTLHDVGKIGVPDSVLNKTGPLNDYERNIMRKHPELGVRIIENIDFMRMSIPYVLFHHERFDGKGYPMGLEGEDIPIEGRLLAVVDTFDAIVSDRPYRRGASPERAIQELIDFRGTQFDPEIVDVFVQEYKAGRIDFAKLYLRLRPSKGLRASLFGDA